MIEHIKIIAHRGFSLSVPENSYESFDLALKAGADGIETDVRMSLDGIPVLHHNRLLKNGQPLSQYKFSEICEICGFEIPVLDVILKRWPGIFWNIEIKTHDAFDPALEIIKHHKKSANFLISSFWHNSIEKISYQTDIDLAFLIANHPIHISEMLSLYKKNDILRTFVWDNEIVTNELLKQVKSHGFNNFIYDVNTQLEFDSIDHDLVSGIITDRPDLLM